MSAEHPEVAFVPRDQVDDLLDRHLIRGQHVRLALAAAETGSELPADLITQVAASPSPRNRPSGNYPDAEKSSGQIASSCRS